MWTQYSHSPTAVPDIVAIDFKDVVPRLQLGTHCWACRIHATDYHWGVSREVEPKAATATIDHH